MRIVVKGGPHAKARSEEQRILATYDRKQEVTIINCDVDIVTLGIAVNVLQEQYYDYLATFDGEVAEKIKETIRKAAKNYEAN